MLKNEYLTCLEHAMKKMILLQINRRKHMKRQKSAK